MRAARMRMDLALTAKWTVFSKRCAMWQSALRCYLFVTAVWIASLAVLVDVNRAQTAAQTFATTSEVEDPLRAFLRTDLRRSTGRNAERMRYFDAFVDLNGDGKLEAIVYLTGRNWCGSGGCTMLLLKPKGSSFAVITRVTIVRPPIRVLNSTSNGWHNLAVWVPGGGIDPGYEAELRFDGKTYPTNPSVPPARRLTRRATGERVIVPARNERGKSLE